MSVGIAVVASQASARTTAQGPTDDPGAATNSGSSETLPLEFHGFVSQGFIKSTGNNYLAESKRGSFEFNEVGLNFTKVLNDRLRLGMQLFARDVGAIGNYTARLDWFYLDYRFADWLGFRAGRTKLPFGLYNEVSDIDSARVPALLPQAVYSIRNRDYLLAQTGVEIYGWRPLGAAGALEYRLYLGTVFADLATPSGPSPVRIDKLDIPYLYGGRIMWETPWPGLRIGVSAQALELDYAFSVVSVASAPPASAEFDAKLWVASIEYAGDRLLLAAEFSRWYIDSTTSIPALYPPSSPVNERYYAMASYRVSPWFVPGAYYSVFFRDADLFDDPNTECRRIDFRRCGRQNFQHDLAATLRFDINPYWLLKLEGHYMRGTADLTTALNGGTALKSLEKNWALFILKTTVHF